MDKATAGLIGAVAGLAAAGSAQAASLPALGVSEAMHAASYAELLAPVPNAAALLKADDAARAQAARIEPARAYYYFDYGYPYAPPRYYPPTYYAPYYPPYYHHHHHHHYRYYHHHHHHWR